MKDFWAAEIEHGDRLVGSFNVENLCLGPRIDTRPLAVVARMRLELLTLFRKERTREQEKACEEEIYTEHLAMICNFPPVSLP